MGLSEADRVLRRVSAWGLVWGLCFLIPYGVRTREVVPPLLLIPQGFSFFIALYHLSNKATHRQLNIALDTLITLFLVGMLIPASIRIRVSGGWRSNGMMMVGAYGTVPAMINIAIHTYFVLREASVLTVLSFIFGNLFSSPTCPHCQREVIYQWGMFGSRTPSSSSASVSKESYASVRHSDDCAEDQPCSSKGPRVEPYRDPRPSTDDESARLV